MAKKRSVKRRAVKRGSVKTAQPQIAAARRCSSGVCDPERTQGLRAPAPNGSHVLVTLEGPGVFLGAAVMRLDLDVAWPEDGKPRVHFALGVSF